MDGLILGREKKIKTRKGSFNVRFYGILRTNRAEPPDTKKTKNFPREKRKRFPRTLLLFGLVEGIFTTNGNHFKNTNGQSVTVAFFRDHIRKLQSFHRQSGNEKEKSSNFLDLFPFQSQKLIQTVKCDFQFPHAEVVRALTNKSLCRCMKDPPA